MLRSMGTFLAIIAVLLSVRPISAQDPSETFMAMPGAAMSAIANTAAMNDVLRDVYGRPKSHSRPAKSSRPAAASTLNYQPSSQLARKALEGYISRIRKTNPVAADIVAKEFGRHDTGKIYRDIVAPFGLRDNNTADALTAYTVLGWIVANGAPDPSPQSVQALRGQIATKLAANPKLSSPETSAALGEELKLLFVTVHAGWQSAKREGTLEEYSSGVTALFQHSGTNLHALRLTDQGFARR